MNAVLCLALLAAVAVIGSRGEPCSGLDTISCVHEHCTGYPGSVFGATYHVACIKDVCTCVASGGSGGPICTYADDCRQIHCFAHGGGIHGHGHQHYSHVACVNGDCHCQH